MMDGGQLALHPILEHSSNEGAVSGEIAWLQEIGIYAPLVGVLDISLQAGAAEHDGRKTTAGRMQTEPVQHFKTVETGHLEVQDHHVGKGMNVAIVEGRVSLEIINGFLAVVNVPDVDGDIFLLGG
jgi:hypothetical protein